MDTTATPLATPLDLFDDAMALCDAETGVIRQANASFAAWTEKPDAKVLAEVFPDLLDDKVRTALAEKGKATIQAECPGDRGRKFAAEFTLKRVEGADGTPLLAVHGRSLARIKEKEAMLASFTTMIDTNNRQLRRQKKAVTDLLDNMRQGVFSVRRDGRVESEFSAYSHTIFGADVPIAHQPFIDLLQLRQSCDAATVQSMEFWLANIFGADELQWMLAEDMGLREVTYRRPTPGGEPEARQLELDYAPIWEDEVVDRIMVIARDVTDLRTLEATVEHQDAEYRQNLDRVSEIAGLDPELFETFMAESRDLLNRCGQAVAKLQDATDGKAAIDELFRHMHTLKGNARIFKITSIQDEAHEAETLLQQVQQGTATLDAEAAARLKASVEGLEQSLTSFEELGQQVLFGISRSSTPSAAQEKALETVQHLVDSGRATLVRLEDHFDADRWEDLHATIERGRQQATSAGFTRLAQVLTPLSGLSQGEAPQSADLEQLSAAMDALATLATQSRQLLEALEHVTDLEDTAREVADLQAAIAQAAKDWETGGDASALSRHLHSLTALARGAHVQPLEQAALACEEAVAVGHVSLAHGPLQDLQGLLSDTTGLIMARQQATTSRRRHAGPVVKVPEARILELRQAYKELQRKLAAEMAEVSALGSAVQRLTMVPVADLTERLSKMVYDLSRELGKSVGDLQVNGDDLQVDAKLLDKLRDVLLHALRNALDHGLETPDVRRSAGKAERGTVRIACEQQDGDLIVAVSDDGRGVDLEKVKAVAFAKSLLSEDGMDQATEDELLQLLFLPGFSTAGKVSDVSGRGVGMDVIASTAADLQGKASIRSVAGQGTTLTLTIPADYFQSL